MNRDGHRFSAGRNGRRFRFRRRNGCRRHRRRSRRNIDDNRRQHRLFHFAGVDVIPVDGNFGNRHPAAFLRNVNGFYFHYRNHVVAFDFAAGYRLFRILLHPADFGKTNFRQLGVDYAGNPEIDFPADGLAAFKCRHFLLPVGVNFRLFGRQPPVAVVCRRNFSHLDVDRPGFKYNRHPAAEHVQSESVVVQSAESAEQTLHGVPTGIGIGIITVKTDFGNHQIAAFLRKQGVLKGNFPFFHTVFQAGGNDRIAERANDPFVGIFAQKLRGVALQGLFGGNFKGIVDLLLNQRIGIADAAADGKFRRRGFSVLRRRQPVGGNDLKSDRPTFRFADGKRRNGKGAGSVGRHRHVPDIKFFHFPVGINPLIGIGHHVNGKIAVERRKIRFFAAGIAFILQTENKSFPHRHRIAVEFCRQRTRGKCRRSNEKIQNQKPNPLFHSQLSL